MGVLLAGACPSILPDTTRRHSRSNGGLGVILIIGGIGFIEPARPHAASQDARHPPDLPRRRSGQGLSDSFSILVTVRGEQRPVAVACRPRAEVEEMR
jgi:hypothetical protein